MLKKTKAVIKFLSIFSYSIFIFLVEGYFLIFFAALNITAMLLLKVKPKDALKYELSLLPFILFAAVFNLALGYWRDAVFLSIRLLLICGITQCYKKAVSMNELALAVETIFYPLKLFNIDSRDTALVVSISLAFIPVLRRDFNSIKQALRSKGIKFNFINAAYFLKPFFAGLFKRTYEISQAIRAKAYE